MLNRFSALAAAGLGCVAAAATNSSCDFSTIRASTDLKWCSCGTNFSCAKLDVPIDYANQSCGRASVPLLKYAAASDSQEGPYQGMVMFIPGGPGGSGITEMLSNASALQAIVGTNWDIVTYDPRGVARSEPALNCSVSGSSAATKRMRRYTVPRVTDAWYNSFVDYGVELGDACAKQLGGELDAGPHMSTSVNARDLVSITDAFSRTADGHRAAKNSSRLSFYAVSYGTVVAQTFASMFPERVGNAVVDGVVRPETYLSGWTEDSINHLDNIFELFFILCNKAGPSLCPYASGSSASDVFARFKKSFVQLDARTAASKHWTNSTEIEESLFVLKNTMLNAAYLPVSYFRGLAEVLVGLEKALQSGKLQQWAKQTIAATQDPSPAATQDWQWLLGVSCSDQNDLYYGKSLAQLQPRIQYLKNQSIIGELWMKNSLGCVGWKIKAKETFTGPFGGNTATPMMFVSNTFDPVAPIENSHFGAPKYKDAQILTIDALGHVGVLTGNHCLLSKVKTYFQHTQLPGKDNFCALESTPFGVKLNGTLRESIQGAGLSNLH